MPENSRHLIVAGSGNAALCAAIAALEAGASVTIIEKASEKEAGGNSRYTAGAMRFAYSSGEDLMPLLQNPRDERLAKTDFGSYPAEQFLKDLEGFNGGRELTIYQQILVERSYETLAWLASHNVKFEPIWSRQAFQKDGKSTFWGGLTLAAEGEGCGMVDAEMKEFFRLGGEIKYEAAAEDLVFENGKVSGVRCKTKNGNIRLDCDALILACGGFEANKELRTRHLGENWASAIVRGTPHNTGKGIEMALSLGAEAFGFYEGCHATPMDLHAPENGNLELPHPERKNYRKISYFLGIMVNARGERFVDEGADFRNYTYAQFGRSVLEQPGGFAWQIFDSKVEPLLYEEYRTPDASFVSAETLEDLAEKMEGVDKPGVLKTIREFNAAVREDIAFDPAVKDGKNTPGLTLPKSNWANKMDAPPFKAYPVTGGITFTYGGLKINENAAVLHKNGQPIPGLFACGELVGGVFFEGYPGGSGLTSGAVFGRMAGQGAAAFALQKMT